MSNEVKNLPASALRKLLIEEIQKFIIALDNASVPKLEEAKIYLTDILNTLSEKERREMMHIPWGKSSSTSDPTFIVPTAQTVDDFEQQKSLPTTEEGTGPASVAPTT